MVKTYVLGASALALMLAGCASQPVGVSTSMMAQWHSKGLLVAPVEHAATVQVKTKGQAVFGAVVGTVVNSAMASSPKSFNPADMQRAQQEGMQANQIVQQSVADYTASLAQSQTPGQAMGIELAMHLQTLGVPHTADSYRVVVKQSTWLLSYDNLFGSDNYRLHYELETEVRNADDDVVTSSDCSGQSDNVQALDAWKASDYAPVKAYARHVGDICTTQLLDNLGLHS